MKNFKMKEQKLSSKADLRIKWKLYMMQVKKSIINIKTLSFAVPVLAAFAIMVFVVQTWPIQNQTGGQEKLVQSTPEVQQLAVATRIAKWLSEIRSDGYKARAKKRAYAQKAHHYKQYAYVRTSSLRGK